MVTKYYAKIKAYQKEHPEKVAEWNRNHLRRLRLSRKMRIIELFGGKCVRCGFDDWRALQVDHVRGGGYQEVKKHKHPDDYYKFIEENATSGRYQLLCANCNWIKRYEDKSGRRFT
jgi:hypothetical protein